MRNFQSHLHFAHVASQGDSARPGGCDVRTQVFQRGQHQLELAPFLYYEAREKAVVICALVVSLWMAADFQEGYSQAKVPPHMERMAQIIGTQIYPKNE